MRKIVFSYDNVKIDQGQFETFLKLSRIFNLLDVCGQGLSLLVMFEDGSMDAQRYINEVLPIALEPDKRMLGND